MGERLDRTQEVAGSSPASSIAEGPAGMMVFLRNKVCGARTINGERGCNSMIDDRTALAGSPAD